MTSSSDGRNDGLMDLSLFEQWEAATIPLLQRTSQMANGTTSMTLVHHCNDITQLDLAKLTSLLLQSRVSPVSNPDDVKTPAAYLLFYVRRTSKPIGGKTHEILASKTVTPALSAAGSRPASPPLYRSNGADSAMDDEGGPRHCYFPFCEAIRN